MTLVLIDAAASGWEMLEKYRQKQHLTGTIIGKISILLGAVVLKYTKYISTCSKY